jgi:hypothetical protein
MVLHLSDEMPYSYIKAQKNSIKASIKHFKNVAASEDSFFVRNFFVKVKE